MPSVDAKVSLQMQFKSLKNFPDACDPRPIADYQ
jgi:hypothetical protein